MEIFGDDMFGGSPFGGLGGFFGPMTNRRRGPPRGEDTVHSLKVSLEELYSGKVTKLQLSKTTLCTDCSGVGGYGTPETCRECRGRGFTVTINQIGPGMVQQVQGNCQSCKGEGEIMDPSQRCTVCEGRKVVPVSKLLEVTVEPGMKHHQKIVFRGEGNQLPGVQPGNVLIVLDEKDHDVFRREGNDLIMDKTITLTEALCGFQTLVPHISGRTLIITHQPGEVIKPKTLKIIPGEGMPIYQSSTEERGNLYMHFNVEFPQNYFATEDKMKLVERLLGGRREETVIPEDHEEVNMEDYEPMPGKCGRGGSDDEEDGRGHPGVACAQQ